MVAEAVNARAAPLETVVRDEPSGSSAASGTGGCLVSVRVTPRASATELLGIADGRLRVRLQAPPVDGAANEALIRFLAALASVPKSAVSVRRGATARDKTVCIAERSAAAVRALLAERLP